MSIVGFDFGTTNSLISVVQGKRVVPLLDDDGVPFPSVACYEGTQVVVGAAAKSRLGEVGLGVHGNVVRSPKTLLGQESVYVAGVERRPIDIVRDVVHFVREQSAASYARTFRQKPAQITSAVVTIPISMNGARRAALREAFHLAGVSIVQFVHEPLAALYGYLRAQPDIGAAIRRLMGQLLLVCDWGGGTLDLTLCKISEGKLLQIANDGTNEVGGDLFDEAIRNELERRVRHNRQFSPEAEVNDDARTRLLHYCERAKIDMSHPGRSPGNC